MSPYKLCLSQLTEQPLRTDTEVFIFLYKETELAREIAIVLVIWSS